ncbi:TBCC domain-containing protein 1 [Phytophthora boehmeriae]|uniref:TBCC domain-containing protein 1 n=1 Tax=Phytophthora boehmeriae TaxID=109152 RepID=A0A8T1XBB0_9STRA|nr:TBCC domain-containing protein 1 [Phytophthora boehmeriae]
MPRIWLRLELFELGLVPLPSKYAATLTLSNVKKALDALHGRFQAAAGSEVAAGDDAVMMDTEGSFVESDNLNSVSFSFWKDAVDSIFQWREQDYKAFWLLLVQFHRMIPVKEQIAAVHTTPLDEEQRFVREEVPVFKLAIFLFIQTVKPHSKRTRYSLDAFNAVWYREHADSLANAAGLEASVAASPKSPVLSAMGSPHLRGSASPPPPASPHAVGMADRSTADSYYLAFVREKLEDLFGLLYPSVDLKDESQTVVSSDQIDLLGFLLCLGDASLVDNNAKLSSCYPQWELSDDSEAGGAQEFVPRVENGAKVCRFYKTQLTLNETLYPPVGFSVPTTAQNNISIAGPPAFSLNDDFTLDGSAGVATPQDEIADRPTILSHLVKTTVIKRAEEFVALTDKSQLSDVIIFSCQDSFIYILGPVRYPSSSSVAFITNVMVSACKNCRIIIAPNTGILSMERCENVQLTGLSGLVRVSNCLDSRLNVYTLSPIIMSGENVGVVLGPYNTKYAGLSQQLATVPYLYNPESQGCWNSFLDLDNEKENLGDTDTEKPPISVQIPDTFRDVCVPVKPVAGAGTAERPFPVPAEYVTAVRKQYETVDSLRQMVTSDEFDLNAKRTMEVVIQLKFKEWLSSTSNVRQILDLVQIERANGSSDVEHKES